MSYTCTHSMFIHRRSWSTTVCCLGCLGGTTCLRPGTSPWWRSLAGCILWISTGDPQGRDRLDLIKPHHIKVRTTTKLWTFAIIIDIVSDLYIVVLPVKTLYLLKLLCKDLLHTQAISSLMTQWQINNFDLWDGEYSVIKLLILWALFTKCV